MWDKDPHTWDQVQVCMAACTGLLVLRSLPGARSCLWAPSPRVGTAVGAQTGSKGAARTQGTEWPPELRIEEGTKQRLWAWVLPGPLRGIERWVLRVGGADPEDTCEEMWHRGTPTKSKKPEGENPCALLLLKEAEQPAMVVPSLRDSTQRLTLSPHGDLPHIHSEKSHSSIPQRPHCETSHTHTSQVFFRIWGSTVWQALHGGSDVSQQTGSTGEGPEMVPGPSPSSQNSKPSRYCQPCPKCLCLGTCSWLLSFVTIASEQKSHGVPRADLPKSFLHRPSSASALPHGFENHKF